MAIKGQKFKSYSEEIKKEAIRLHVEERWTYRQRMGAVSKSVSSATEH